MAPSQAKAPRATAPAAASAWRTGRSRATSGTGENEGHQHDDIGPEALDRCHTAGTRAGGLDPRAVETRGDPGTLRSVDRPVEEIGADGNSPKNGEPKRGTTHRHSVGTAPDGHGIELPAARECTKDRPDGRPRNHPGPGRPAAGKPRTPRGGGSTMPCCAAPRLGPRNHGSAEVSACARRGGEFGHGVRGWVARWCYRESR